MAKSVEQKEYQKQYREQNKERMKEYQKQYREQNKERLKECQKQYREKNKEKLKEYSKQYYEGHKEKKLEYHKQYYRKNKEKKKEYQKQDYYWYKSHGICPYCKTNYSRKGKTSCSTCAANFAMMYALMPKKKPPLTDSQKERSRKRNKRYKDLLVAFGVCQSCGQRDAAPNHTLCLDCLIKKKRRSIEYNRKKGCITADLRYNSGFCYFCCKKIDDGQILCEECKNKKAKCAEYARSFIDKEKMRKQQVIYFKRG